MTVTPLGCGGRRHGRGDGGEPGFASIDDEVATVAVWISVGVTPVPVTVATTVIGGSEVPPANGPLLLVQVMVCPDGAAQTQPEPNAPRGTTPVGTVWVTEIGDVSVVPASTPAVIE